MCPEKGKTMCQHCNYSELLGVKNLAPTPHRLSVMEVIGNSTSPIGANEIYKRICKTVDINRVTVYRILDLLVEKKLVERLSGMGRSLLYGISPCEHHPAHPHFHCKKCGAMYCLQPFTFNIDIKNLHGVFAGEMKDVEIRINGVCRDCLREEAPGPFR